MSDTSAANDAANNTAEDAKTTAKDAKSTWNEVRNLIAARFDKLTHEDFDRLKGQVGKLADLVQQRYGISYEDAKGQVQEFEKGLSEDAARLYQGVHDKVQAKYRDARANVGDIADDVRNFGFAVVAGDLARRNPAATALAAFALGFAVRSAFVSSCSKRRYRW